MPNTIPVAVLGATGTVGQKIIAMIEQHPLFHVAEVAASHRSEGKKYLEACTWREPLPFPEKMASLTLKELSEVTSPFALSALPADSAKEIEPLLASKGIHVISNASAFRMQNNVPLIIPEINASHIELVKAQSTPGKIITNPNCSTVFLALGLAPLMKLGKINHVSVTTLQALSGAGYPGVPSFDLIGNVIPNIGGEEEKIEQEANKILGEIDSPAVFDLTVHVNRVPVVHGHSISMHVFFENEVKASSVREAFEVAQRELPGAYKLHFDDFSPQPARDLTHDDQRAHIGRIKQGGNSKVVGLVSMGHNLVRGAAGAAIKNLELAQQTLG